MKRQKRVEGGKKEKGRQEGGERQGREQEREGGFFKKRVSATREGAGWPGGTPVGLVPNAKTACVFVRKKTADFLQKYIGFFTMSS